MKAHTNFEQSKKLAKILPIESADMWFVDGLAIMQVALKEKDFISKFENVFPCWSLSALLEVLPLGIEDEFDNYYYELEIHMIDKMPRYIRLGDIYHSQFPYDFEKDTLLDNIVESIIWLYDNKYFEL